MDRDDDAMVPMGPMAASPYPCGLCLTLTHEELEKLGYTELPPAGTMCKIEAVACVVCSTSHDPDADGDCDYCSITLQVTEMAMEETGEEEDEEEKSDGRAERMYGRNKQKA